MKIAYFDCQFGAAGDMLAGALLSAGVQQSSWLAELEQIALQPGSFEIKVIDATACTIAAKKVNIACRAEQCERTLADIMTIIEDSKISIRAKELSGKIFQNLALAEGKVHGLSPESVHFHEVGAIDAIVDIVGFAIGLEMLGIERCTVSPLPPGSGTVATRHGVFPVPGPAVLNLIAGASAPTCQSDIDYECLTPTGAAILTTIADCWGTMPPMEKICSIGYGAGNKDEKRWPNVVRLTTGLAAGGDLKAGQSDRFSSENIAVVEANLDDFSPQALSFACDRILEAGALDAFVLPAVMKKGRSGHLLSVLCREDESVRFQELIINETSSIGVRTFKASRLIARRQWIKVTLPGGGQVRIKAALDRQGLIVNAQPEYEDCAAYAREHAVPLKQVMAEAISCFTAEQQIKP